MRTFAIFRPLELGVPVLYAFSGDVFLGEPTIRIIPFLPEPDGHTGEPPTVPLKRVSKNSIIVSKGVSPGVQSHLVQERS